MEIIYLFGLLTAFAIGAGIWTYLDGKKTTPAH